MFGMFESLNHGTSCGIVLYEVAKQRREYQAKYRWRDQRGERATPLPTVANLSGAPDREYVADGMVDGSPTPCRDSSPFSSSRAVLP
jgi:hypothetical protein